MKITTFFHKQKNSLKRKDNLNLHNFNNRNTITKIRLPSHITSQKTPLNDNLQEEMRIANNCEKKEIEDEIHIFFSRNKFDNIRWKRFNDINEVITLNCK